MHLPPTDSVTAPGRTAAGASRSARVLGIDLARGLALFGMMATHILPRIDESGALTLVGHLQGRASALFAILAGVSIILSTRSVLARPGARAWSAAATGLAVRGAFIALIGLFLGELPSGIAVILVNYGALFLLAPLFLRFPTWLLGVTAWAWFLVTPLVSHALRSGPLGDGDLVMPAFSSLLVPDMWTGLVLTGYYPLLQWLGYIVLGMWLGRIDWTDAGRRVSLLLVGAAAAILSLSASSLLMNMRGRWELESLYGQQWDTGITFVDEILLLGSYGVAPTDSLWWLVVAAPHSGTPFDLVQTAGVAMAVIALCLLIGSLLDRGPVWTHAWLSRPGSTPLTLYTLHICVLAAAEGLPAMPAFDGFSWAAQWFTANIALMIVVALLWTALVSRRGPLESILTVLVRAVQQAVLGAPRAPVEAGAAGPGAVSGTRLRPSGGPLH